MLLARTVVKSFQLNALWIVPIMIVPVWANVSEKLLYALMVNKLIITYDPEVKQERVWSSKTSYLRLSLRSELSRWLWWVWQSCLWLPGQHSDQKWRVNIFGPWVKLILRWWNKIKTGTDASTITVWPSEDAFTTAKIMSSAKMIAWLDLKQDSSIVPARYFW